MGISYMESYILYNRRAGNADVHISGVQRLSCEYRNPAGNKGKSNGYKRKHDKKAGKICLSIVLALVTIALALVVVITYHMVYAAHVKPKQDATVVVLGCAVRGGGPSLMLRERLIAAQDYLDENPEAVCVVSGGQGADESMSEAQCMYEYLTEHGISPERIYMEDKSTSTRENIKFSAQIIEQNDLPDGMNIVTNEFHEYRAKRIAEKQGIDTGSIAGSTASSIKRLINVDFPVRTGPTTPM